MILSLLLLLSIAFIVLCTAKWNVHPFLALLFAAFGFGLCSGMPLPTLLESIEVGFGGTLGKIGIVIIFGTIIGVFLEKSGGAYRIAAAILKLTGKKNVPLAMGCIGYVVSIPVFCDSGFVILSPLKKALAKEAKLSLAGCAIALALGLYATHTMVPPTPGPIFAAAKLGADLGTVIFYGLLTSAFALLVGWAYAVWVGSRCYIDPAPELSEDALQQRMASAPCTIKAFIPIVLPLVLIVLKSIATYPTHPLGTGSLIPMLTFFGNPIVALCLGVLAAFFLPKQWDKSMFSSVGWVGDALHSAAIIILITGAGGAFGKVLQNAGIADAISGPLANLHLGIWLPFLIAAAIKTAQGSSTVAIVTTASLLAPLCAPLGFTSPDQLALVVIMIGAGSMVISHANDSYFWVVTQFSRMDLWTGYKFYSTGTLIEGLAAGGAVWLLYTFWL